MKNRMFVLACIILLCFAASAFAVQCDSVQVTPVKAKQQYSDYYGTTITSNPSMLTTPAAAFRWGITNPKPLDMAYFAAYVMTGKQKFEYFRAKIYIDGSLKAPVIFTFQNNSRTGETLETVTVRPGETKTVDFPINGVQKLYIASEIKINHGGAQRLIIGEPEFYNCRK